SDALGTALFERGGEGAASLRDAVHGADPVYAAALATVSDRDIAQGVFDMLARPLTDILRTGWNDLVDLQQYLDPERHPPGETAKVGVARHKLDTSWTPELEIRINERTVRTLAFEVKLTLKIEGTVLTIRDRRVWEAGGTRLTGEAELFCEGFRLTAKQVEKMELPGSLRFEGGLPIPELIG
ncbi:MAG: hypothetical protein AAFW69_11985, partial [Pseudomonadota bacterium]